MNIMKVILCLGLGTLPPLAIVLIFKLLLDK